MRSSKPRTAYIHTPKRLAQLHARRAARLATELDDPAHLRNLVEESLVGLVNLWPTREKDALRCPCAGVRYEISPHVVGDEGHDRGDHAQTGDEREPQRTERGGVVGVEAPSRAADVPVREVVDECLEGGNQ